MPNNFKAIAKNIQEIILDNPKIPGEKLKWIKISNAGKKEIEFLRKKYDFNLNHLRASSAKSIAQRPSISQGDNYLFLILHFPIFNAGQILAGEIDFFISQDYLITLSTENIDALNKFFNLCKKEGDSLLSYRFESAAVLLYELLKKLMADCFTMLDKISIDITNVENLIFEQKQKTAVANILSLRRNIINFRRIMQNHKNILKKLLGMESGIVPSENIKEYYKELIDYSKTIWEILDNQKEIIDVLNDTNESLMNYRLNDIMKTLTIFSVIVFPLTLLAAIFGMNTINGMPFINSINGFWMVIIIMLFGSLGMLIFFKKKKWL